MASEVNLLQDTINSLFINGKTPNDVLWVGDKNFHTDWKGFEKVANVEYENIGGGNIYSSLMIVGSNWWLKCYLNQNNQRHLGLDSIKQS